MIPVVLITGASGGFGAGLVSSFRQSGWRVAAGFHRNNIHKRSDDLLPVKLDVTDLGQAAEAIAEINAHWGGVNALINNAGITRDRLSWQLSEREWEEVLDVHLAGAMICSRAVVPSLCARGGGHIVNISSYAAKAGRRGQANYAAAKAGLVGLTQAMAKELGKEKICVNAVMPGAMATDMLERLNPAEQESLRTENVLQRLNTVEEAARFVVFLTSMNHVSGQVFQIDSRIASWC